MRHSTGDVDNLWSIRRHRAAHVYTSGGKPAINSILEEAKHKPLQVTVPTSQRPPHSGMKLKC